MTDFHELADRYIQMWNETSDNDRRGIVDDLWARDARYVDPLADVTGRDAIASLVGAVQSQFPDAVFSLRGPIDAHHDQVRFAWGLGAPDQEPAVIGFDVAIVDLSGQLSAVWGFLDKAPAPE